MMNKRFIIIGSNMPSKCSIHYHEDNYVHIIFSAEPDLNQVFEIIGKCEAMFLSNKNINLLLDVRTCKGFRFTEEFQCLARSFSRRVAVLTQRTFLTYFKHKINNSLYLKFFFSHKDALAFICSDADKSIHNKENYCSSKMDEGGLICKKTLNLLDEPIVFLGLERNIEFANQAFYRLFGYENTDVIGASYDSFLCFDKVNDQEGFTKKDKGLVPVEPREHAVCSVEGDKSGFLISLTTFSQGVDRNELNTVKRRLEVALEASLIGVWEYNIVDNELIWDEQMYQLYGVKEESFSGAYDAWASGIHPEDLVRSESELQQAIEGVKKFDTQFRVCYPSGEIRHIRAIAKVERSSFDKPLRIIGANWDITREIKQSELLKKSKEESDRANRSKSDFLSNMSHEIRTPMNGVLGMAELLQEENLSEQQTLFVNTILSSGRMMMTVLNDVLDYSKIDANELNIEKHNFHFVDMIQSLIHLFKFDAELKGLKMTYCVDPSVPEWVFSDSVRIRQVLSNLLSNALKFTKQGSIHLSIKYGGSKLYFYIQDTGIGIPQDKLEEIFLSFKQADSSTTRKYGGTGLGLTISRRLVEILGGKLELTSEIGKGSEFSFGLMIEEGKPIVSEKECAVLSNSETKILVVEDNEVNRMLIVKFLDKLGFSSDVATDGADALRKFDNKKYDIVFMDCQMPVMDGYEASLELRKNYDKKDVVIIALTAHALGGERDRCLDAGMNDYLTKPLSKKRLDETLCRWIQKNTGEDVETTTGSNDFSC